MKQCGGFYTFFYKVFVFYKSRTLQSGCDIKMLDDAQSRTYQAGLWMVEIVSGMPLVNVEH